LGAIKQEGHKQDSQKKLAKLRKRQGFNWTNTKN